MNFLERIPSGEVVPVVHSIASAVGKTGARVIVRLSCHPTEAGRGDLESADWWLRKLGLGGLVVDYEETATLRSGLALPPHELYVLRALSPVPRED